MTFCVLGCHGRKGQSRADGHWIGREAIGSLLKNNQINPMKTVAMCLLSNCIIFTYLKYRVKTIIHSRPGPTDVLFCLTLKLTQLTQASLKNYPVTLIPSGQNIVLFSALWPRHCACGQGLRRDPGDTHLPMDFGSRFLTNSVWSPTCRMLYTLLFISSSWLYLRYCVTFSETNTTLPSRFTTKKNPSRA